MTHPFTAAARETARRENTPEANAFWLGCRVAEENRPRDSKKDGFLSFYKRTKTNKERAAMVKAWYEGFDAFKAQA